MGKKEGKLSDSHFKEITELIQVDLEVYDLLVWQKACKSFGPIHYDSETRKQWFQNNQFRLEAAREITEFVESWIKGLREKKQFNEYTIETIRTGIIQAVRMQQKEAGAELGLLNPVKLNGFKTLIKWADDKNLLEEGPYNGAKEIPAGEAKRTTRRPSRKKRKGRYGPPIVNLIHDYYLISESRLRLCIGVGNCFIHPYQNVNLELEIDSRLSVLGVPAYSWSPKTNTIPIGFLEASLDEDVKDKVIEIDLIINRRTSEYNIAGRVIYDNCERGIVDNHELQSVTLKIR